MVKRATLGVLGMLLLVGLFVFNWPTANAQTATPSQAVITVSGVPTGTQGLAVEVTVDTAIVTLGSASTSVSGALAVTGSMSEGVGIISTSGDLPASFTITVPLTGVAAGTSSLAVGKVLDMLGGTEITGATAAVDKSSVTVASSSTSTSSTSSTSSGGMLSADTITITVEGQSVAATNALNVTLGFSDSNVATLDTGVTFTGAGAAQLLTDVDTGKGLLSVVWSGTITDNKAVITAMLKAGSKAGSTNISVTKVEAAGGTDITGSIAATVSPSIVTNGASSSTSGGGTFTLIGPTSVVGPGKAAVAFSASDTSSMSAKLNGKTVHFVGGGSVGIAIVDLPSSGDLALMLSIGDSTVDLGSVTVTAGEGQTLPKITSARAQNRSTSTILRVLGKRFSQDTTTLEIVPTDRASSSVVVKGKVIKAIYDPSECIPKGSYVNVTTAQGTAAKKIHVKGACSNSLVE